jgi:hypothetical protein
VGQHDLADAVVIVTIEGDGEPVTPATIEEYAGEEGALVTRVTDHREIGDGEDIDVSFADPDDAVRERVHELGLSEAARDLDETVRASKVADANVTDEVERRVRDLIEEGDADVFDPAPPGDTDTEGAADGNADASSVTDDDDGPTTETAEDLMEADGGGGGSSDGDPASAAETDGDGQLTMSDYERGGEE